jgi:hypothetical protein
MAEDKTKLPATQPAAAINKKPEVGFRADSTAFPGVDPDTGQRRAVTWHGLREEFGIRNGSKLYNDIAVAAFGGVQPGRPSLSLLTMQDKYMRPQGKHETAEDYAKTKERFAERRTKVERLLSEAVKGE